MLGCSLSAIESRIEMRHREAAGVGYSTGYTSLDYFLMGEGESAEFLLDLRGHLFNNARGAGNAGLGFRIPINGDKSMVGASVFYDIRQAHDLFCNQIGIGFEWLNRYVDFRTNGYMPIGKQKHTEKKDFRTFSGTTAKVRYKLQAALPSIDAEVGTPLPRPFYFAVGTYYLFEQKGIGLEVGQAWGARVRADVDCGRYVTLGVSATYDHIFKTRVQGILSINIPFEKNWCEPKKKCKYETETPRRNLRRVAIMRNEIVPIEDKKESDFAMVNTDGDPIRFLFVNNTADINGDGSFEKPFAFLKDAERQSSPGDVIYVLPGNGTSTNQDEGIVLKNKQILASSACPIIIDNVFIPAQTPNIAPVIWNIHVPNDEPKITNPGNTRLEDFLFQPPWEYHFGRDGPTADPFELALPSGFEAIQS
jgi:hypothetical protein